MNRRAGPKTVVGLQDKGIRHTFVSGVADERTVDVAKLRFALENAFSPETAQPGTGNAEQCRSTGHCAAVSVIVWDRFGGDLLSAFVAGQSHWFNRLCIGSELVDVDLTGDQFGFPAVRVMAAGELHEDVKYRSLDDLRVETLNRAAVLADRARLTDTARRLERICRARAETS